MRSFTDFCRSSEFKHNERLTIKFTMEVATDTLEFLDLKLKFDKESEQVYVDEFAKDTNS